MSEPDIRRLILDQVDALKAKLATVTAERDALREALEYCIVLDNLYVGNSFQNEPKGSNAAHLANIWRQMIEYVDATLNPSAAGDPALDTEKTIDAS